MTNMISRILEIPIAKRNLYNTMMQCESVDYAEHDIKRYSTIARWTVDFGDGYEVDLKVCSSDTNDPLWCEAVLFLNGNEVACSEVEDELDGNWFFDHDGKEFVLIVIQERKNKLSFTFDSKEVSLQYPDAENKTYLEYCFEEVEQKKLYDFFKTFDCIWDIDMNCGMTADAVRLSFKYNTPDETIKEICEKAIELMWNK